MFDWKSNPPPFGFEYQYAPDIPENKRKMDDLVSSLNEAQCKYCQKTVPGERLKNHEKYCPKALKTCKTCKDLYHLKEEMEHQKICGDFISEENQDFDAKDSNEDAEKKLHSDKENITKIRKQLLNYQCESKDEVYNTDSSKNDILEAEPFELSDPADQNNGFPEERSCGSTATLFVNNVLENECVKNTGLRTPRGNSNSYDITIPIIDLELDDESVCDTDISNKDSDTKLICNLNSAYNELFPYDQNSCHIENFTVSINLEPETNSLAVNSVSNESTANPTSKYKKDSTFGQSETPDIPIIDLTSSEDDDYVSQNENPMPTIKTMPNHECSLNTYCVLTELSAEKENAHRKNRRYSSNSMGSKNSLINKDDFLRKRKHNSLEESVSDDRSTIKRNYNSRKRRRYISIDSSEREPSCNQNYSLDRAENIEFPNRRFLDREPVIESSFSGYHCKICDISVTSEVSLKTHLVGKKHQKVLRNMNASEVARQSLSSSSHMSSIIPEEKLRYPTVAPGMRRIRLKKRATLQAVAESTRKYSIAGLSYVTEIHLPNEFVYYCKLCDSTCAASSIMLHLIGFKHKLQYVKKRHPEKYQKFHCKDKKVIKHEIERIVYRRDRAGNRGLIKVEKDVPLLNEKGKHNTRRLSSLCSEGESDIQNRAKTIKKGDTEMVMADLHCKICDTYMSSFQVWEAHMKGRRHNKNAKKLPGEQPSKRKTYRCPGETAHLINDLKYYDEPIVGLDYIQETQGRSGDQYMCLICTGCFTTYDIFDHLTSDKHRKKYLETMCRKGYENSIGSIKAMYSLPADSIKTLLAYECEKMQQKYGRGTVTVYKTKDIYSDLYGPDHQHDIF